ncbi:hypothetical protein CLOM_g1263 [Closterium sp. NIES-68]|nr:hypothetical protein CLOM_g1263 [Closterium sp. NIES-68]GJP80815.1 hypothetical protein CLOP_g11012 [Closterium sp. NIES-67]
MAAIAPTVRCDPSRPLAAHRLNGAPPSRRRTRLSLPRVCIASSSLPTALAVTRRSVFSHSLSQRVRQPRRCKSARWLVRADASSGETAPGGTAEAAKASDRRRARVAVFVSGGGSNFKAIHAACADGRVNGDVVVVVSDKPECGGWQYARANGIPTLAFPVNAKLPPAEQHGLTPDQLLQAMRQHAVDYIVLAGYLKLLPASLVEAFPRAILNVHPALLPAFGGKGYYGMRVHKAVIASGARVSGPTVHFVDERYDHGPIVAQAVVPVLPFDDPPALQARVLAQEHRLYARVVAALCDCRVEWREDGVPVIRSADDDNAFE